MLLLQNPQLLKIRFGHLLTMTGKEVSSGELIVESGEIHSVDTKTTSTSSVETVDLSDCLLIPGFVNAHCHLTLSALKGQMEQSDSFTDWVLSLLEKDAAIDEGRRFRAFHSEANEMARSGVTTLADYLSQPNWLPEYAKLPFRQIVFLEVIGFQSSKAKEIRDRIEMILQGDSPAPERIVFGLAPHAPYSVSPELFKALRELADVYGIPFSCHVAELEEESGFLQDGGGDLRRMLDERGAYDADWNPPGKSTLQYLEDLAVLDSLIAVHLNHLGRDKNLLVSNFMSGVFCPRSTRWFGREDYLDVSELLHGSVAVGIGTDSLASNDSLNYLDELRAAANMLPKLTRKEILELATRRGAEALGLKTGSLVSGMPADLIAFRVDRVPTSWYDVPFEPDRKEVDFCMIGGRIILPKN